MAKLSRREREKQNRRNEILQAAWKVFASKDYDAATIDDVAAMAELSKGTVYLYFENKADLFYSTIEMGVEQINIIAQEALSSSDDPVSGIKNFIIRLLDFSENSMDFFKIMSSGRSHFEMHAKMENDRDFKNRMVNMVTNSVSVLSDYIQNGVNMGVFKQVNPEDAAFVLFAVVRGFAFRRIIDPGADNLPEKAEVIADILLDGLQERK